MIYNAYMDMQKKLTETYLPDKEARNKRLVVGLSGGLNSYVTAYLLKIQKYDLVGVSVLLNWENYKEDASQVLACHKDHSEIEKVKEFCHQLGIPHMLVKASDEFKEEVIENWMGHRITGTKPNSCWNCHELRMRLLHQKMVEMDAQGIATGHLAKLFRQESHGTVYVHSSNDELFDQSAILSRLPHHVLDKLMLPLSDLQQKEITKLAENFGLSTTPVKVKMHECLDSRLIPTTYFQENIPAGYLKPGEILGVEKSFGEHQGVAQFQYGEIFPLPNRQSEPLYVGQFSYNDKTTEVYGEEHFQRKSIFLTNCKISEETPWSEPLKGVARVSDLEFIDCWIYPKNLSSALIELETPARIVEGCMLSVLKKKGKNAKVYLTGKVRYVKEDKPIIEEGIERAKVDYSRDF